jgi:hypothetical protein
MTGPKPEVVAVSVPEAQVVEERVAELVRVTASVCQTQPDAAVSVQPHSETQRIPELANQPVADAPSAGGGSKVTLVVGWVMSVAVIVGGLASSSLRQAWQALRGFSWRPLPQKARGFACQTWQRAKGLSSKLVGLIRRRDSKAVFPRLGKPAVQTELSLETVQVVRNSLEDSDLEVVTASTTTSSQIAPTKPVLGSKRGPVPPALKKITGPLVSVKAFEQAMD